MADITPVSYHYQYLFSEIEQFIIDDDDTLIIMMMKRNKAVEF